MKQRSNKSKAGRKPGKSSGQISRVEPESPLSGRRKWLFRFGAAILLPLLLLVGLELVLRLAGYGYATGFFEPMRIGGKVFLVNNEDFILRFFPPQLARFPSPVMMEAQKPAGTYRIFVLGESAARGEPEPPYAASRYLEALLSERFPNTHFEVVNLGITAINSHVILPIARDCAKAGGDLWIIYMGNNEMVGPFGAATVFGAKAPPLEVVRLNLAIQQTCTGQLLVDLSRRLRAGRKNTSWGGMGMFVGNEIRANDPRKNVVYGNFARNLNDIVRAGLNSGAKIVLNTVAVNLKDCPPFASTGNSNLPASDTVTFNKIYAGACTDEARADYATAAQKFALAAKMNPRFPDLQYHWGRCLLALTNNADARDHLQKACDDDALPFRADSRINEAIQEVGRRFAGDQLVVLDAAALLAAEVPDGVCGQETFFEHVHFNLEGNFRLGCAWADQVEKMLPAGIVTAAHTNGWASQESCDRLLGLTDWNRGLVLERMLALLATPPLSDQSNNAGRMESLRNNISAILARMSAATAQSAMEQYQAAITRAPQDYWLHENFAEFLEATGDLKAAVTQWQQVCDLLPHCCEPFCQAGRLLATLGQSSSAQSAFTEALSLRPRNAETWRALGGVELGNGRFDSALQDYNHARELDPQNASYCAYAGEALSKLDRHPEAVSLYRQAIELKPDSVEAHFGLGDEMFAASRFSEAEHEYAQVIQLQPTIALAHLDLGLTLERLSRFDDAVQEFQQTLQLEPGNPDARTELERLQGLRSQPR